MVNETVPKDILDKLNAGIEITGTDVDIRDLTSVSDSVEVLQDTASDLNAAVVNAAGTGLTTLRYGSSDGGSNWYPEKLGVLADTGTLVGNSSYAVDGITTLYTVGAGKILYVISATLGFWMVDVGANNFCYLKLNGVSVMSIYGTDTQDDQNVTTSNFTIPVKLTAGQTIQIQSESADLQAYGSFAGYLIDA